MLFYYKFIHWEVWRQWQIDLVKYISTKTSVFCMKWKYSATNWILPKIIFSMISLEIFILLLCSFFLPWECLIRSITWLQVFKLVGLMFLSRFRRLWEFLSFWEINLVEPFQFSKWPILTEWLAALFHSTLFPFSQARQSQNMTVNY